MDEMKMLQPKDGYSATVAWYCRNEAQDVAEGQGCLLL